MKKIYEKFELKEYFLRDGGPSLAHQDTSLCLKSLRKHSLSSFRNIVVSCLLFIGASAVNADPFNGVNTQVPFGDLVSENIYHYNRQTPFIATSGRLNGKAIEELSWLGFRTVLDLRQPEEGVAQEKEELAKAGIVHYNIPVGAAWPDVASLKKFKTIVEDKTNYPLLVHCASANRVGFMWTIYQMEEKHTPLESAILQGQTIGMKPELEKLVRERFKR